MTREQEARQTPQSQKRASNQTDSFMSPNFRSMAAMAGWDEEALLVAALVVEDTPDRDLKCKRRSILSTSNSKRKRRNQNQNHSGTSPNPDPVINLVEERIGAPKEGSEKESKVSTEEGTKEKGIGDGMQEKGAGFSGFPCMDRLREELSCAICLEICFEPSTTPCGHSFCKKCLRSAADKCGKRCPKCRQLISNGRSCIVNTVLWNTIQLLFPEEVKGRKALGPSTEQESKGQRPEIGCPFGLVSSRSSRVAALSTSRRDVGTRRQRGVPSQDEDAALAQRLQREEFRQAFGATSSEEARRGSISLSTINESSMARAMRRLRPTIDVRAMAASRAMSRRRPT